MSMLRKWWQGPERRKFPRLEAAIELSVRVELYGFEDASMPFFASGSTRNVSRGGLLAALDAPVSEGSICKVFLHDAADQVRPHHVAGRVVRCEEDGEKFLVAVEFDHPLTRLQVERSGVRVASE
jgi:hypothetical protein